MQTGPAMPRRRANLVSSLPASMLIFQRYAPWHLDYHSTVAIACTAAPCLEVSISLSFYKI